MNRMTERLLPTALFPHRANDCETSVRFHSDGEPFPLRLVQSAAEAAVRGRRHSSSETGKTKTSERARLKPDSVRSADLKQRYRPVDPFKKIKRVILHVLDFHSVGTAQVDGLGKSVCGVNGINQTVKTESVFPVSGGSFGMVERGNIVTKSSKSVLKSTPTASSTEAVPVCEEL